MSMTVLKEDGPHFETIRDGHAGIIVLNRPKALNALTLSMIQEMTKALIAWQNDPTVRHVIVKSDCQKAFCAGGDVRAVYDDKNRGNHYFETEYLLNYMIGIYPKPYISLIDGIAMGGGLGISMHGSHRIVTEKALLAMPESAIGFFPDVGASYFLNKCPGEVGAYLAVLGNAIGAEDALYGGLATHHVASQDLEKLYNVLIEAQSRDDIDDILQEAAGGQGDCFLQENRQMIDRCFSFNTVEEIFDALRKESNPSATLWLKESHAKSPTSMKLALALMRRSKGLSLKEVLSLDYTISQNCLKHTDFFEGVRALLVDKDRQPRWNPSTLEAVDAGYIESFFR